MGRRLIALFVLLCVVATSIPTQAQIITSVCGGTRTATAATPNGDCTGSARGEVPSLRGPDTRVRDDPGDSARVRVRHERQ